MQDPYLILGVTRDASDETIHQAYLEAIRRCPAEQDPDTFQAVRAAYELIRTRRSRLDYELFNTDLPTRSDLLQRLTRGSRAQRPGYELFRELLRAVPRVDQP
ncbi:MAG: J domain-containing protein [Gammaproteobacteria bacterium]|nr:J domain-containing protein [SAR324 cluster bacterium]MCZ6830119.1 J domain-containing protein [Gammaproteobacteria bacterium]